MLLAEEGEGAGAGGTGSDADFNIPEMLDEGDGSGAGVGAGSRFVGPGFAVADSGGREGGLRFSDGNHTLRSTTSAFTMAVGEARFGPSQRAVWEFDVVRDTAR